MENENYTKLEEFKKIYSKMSINERKETLIFIIDTIFDKSKEQQKKIQERAENE